MKTSIIIPTLNEEKYLPRLLHSISQQTHPPYEVIVVDAGSTDATKSIAKRFGAKVISHAPGIAAQRNTGAAHASGELLFFCDADAILPPKFLKNCIIQITRRELDVACPQYIPAPGGLFITAVYDTCNTIFKLAQHHHPSGAGSCIITKKSTFDKIGGYPNHIFEDMLFLEKVPAHGRFGFLRQHCFVSDRRFRKYGVIRTSITYIILSLLFSLRLYNLTKRVSYPFAEYDK